jgi:hypothetical protein
MAQQCAVSTRRFHRWPANLCVLAIEEVKSVPYSPLSHPFIERLIGTVRREYLDHMFFWNRIDLTRKLDVFVEYHNTHRVHRSPGGTTPARHTCGSSAPPARASLSHDAWEEHCRVCFTSRFRAEYEFATVRMGQAISHPRRQPRGYQGTFPDKYPSLTLLAIFGKKEGMVVC